MPDVRLGIYRCVPAIVGTMFDDAAATCIIAETRQSLLTNKKAGDLAASLNVIGLTLLFYPDQRATDGEVVRWANQVIQRCKDVLAAFEYEDRTPDALSRRASLFSRWSASPSILVAHGVEEALKRVAELMDSTAIIAASQNPIGKPEVPAAELRIFSDIHRAYRINFGRELTARDPAGGSPGQGQRFCSAVLGHIIERTADVPELQFEHQMLITMNTPARIAARVKATKGPDFPAPAGWRMRDQEPSGAKHSRKK